jgi:hypothetical protein
MKQGICTVVLMGIFIFSIQPSLAQELSANQAKFDAKVHPSLTRPAIDDVSDPTSNAVVLVNGGCSGTLIASDMIITAAHCIPAHVGGDSDIWGTAEPVWVGFRFQMAIDDCCITGLKGQSPMSNTNILGWDYRNYNPSPPDAEICQRDCEADGSCEAWTYVKPGYQGPAAVCYLKQQKVRVDFGNTRGTPVYTAWASAYSMPGFDDIALVHLDNVVPTSVAIPAHVLTRVPGSSEPQTFLRSQNFTFTGWGGGHRVRRKASAEYGEFPFTSFGTLQPNMMYGRGLEGVTLEPGDSGSPIFITISPPTGVRYLIGVAQGIESSGGRFVMTFGVGDGRDKPNISQWVDTALYQAFHRDAERMPVYNWWHAERKDNFLTTDPHWASDPRGLLWTDDNLHILNLRDQDGYDMYRLEGYIFNPKQPQPPGTVPLYSWWNPERNDNFATTDPRWSMDPSTVRWEGEHITNGRRQDDYTMYRLEGYILAASEPLFAVFLPLAIR